jgi:hypothetical protein
MYTSLNLNLNHFNKFPFNINSILLIVFFVIIAILVFGIVAIITAFFLIRDIKISKFIKKNKSLVTYEVDLPMDNEIEIQAADQMFRSLSGMKSPSFFDRLLGNIDYISFEIVATAEIINFYVISSKELSDFVEKQIHSSYPTAEVKLVERPDIFKNEAYVNYANLGFSKKSFYPIKIYGEELKVDTISSITSAISKLSEGEYASFQLVIYPSTGKWVKAGHSYTKPSSSKKDEAPKPESSNKQYTNQKIDEKTKNPGFVTSIRLVSVSSSKERAKSVLTDMVSSFSQFSEVSGNKFKKSKLKYFNEKDFALGFLFSFPSLFNEYFPKATILNTSELATIFHFPNKTVQTPHINWLNSKRAPVSADVPTSGLFLGNGIYRSTSRPVFIDEDDRRRHMYVVGRTGTGKSVFLESLVLQDIQAGKGVAFLDPHGQAAESILARIPPERADDVIYFNAGDYDRPMGLNIMEFYSEEDKHMIVNSFYHMLEKLFDPNRQGITGPRLERAVRNCMLTAMSKPGNTLIEVFRLVLLDQKFIDEMLPYVQDDLVRKYWTEEIAQTSDYHKSETLGYFASKFDRFVVNKMMRNILGQSKSSFNMREIMDNQKILIVNLDKGRIGEENSQFLGLLLVPKILSAAMSRSDLPEEQRKDFYLYVDEFQNFATEDFAQILSESRKYRLNLIVANQYISQMIEEVKNAVFGNVGSLISFKVGVSDAEFLSKEYEPIFNEQDLVNLENRFSYVKMLANGEVQPPFSMQTIMSSVKPDPQIYEAIKKLSRLKYGRDIHDVEDEIKSRGLLENTVNPSALEDLLKQK